MEKPILPMGTSGVSLINTQVERDKNNIFVFFILPARGGAVVVSLILEIL